MYTNIIFDQISLSSSKNEKYFRKDGKIKKHILCSKTFFKKIAPFMR
jgi:hypothetical protein